MVVWFAQLHDRLGDLATPMVDPAGVTRTGAPFETDQRHSVIGPGRWSTWEPTQIHDRQPRQHRKGTHDKQPG